MSPAPELPLGVTRFFFFFFEATGGGCHLGCLEREGKRNVFSCWAFLCLVSPLLVRNYID